MELVETIFPLKECIKTPYNKYKYISNFPCVKETRQAYKTKPRKKTFTKSGKKVFKK